MITRILLIVLLLCASPAALAEPCNTIPVSSAVDRKAYCYLQLDNQLKVLLVSDPATDSSAAALDVYAGSGSDPDGWQGLAHFLEHMLFLGTRKYPKVDEYQEFLKNHGGASNAWTSFSHTNYHFSIGAEYLEPALDRFSQFFIAPTFDQTYVDRERSVVHSEYQARKKDEQRRLWAARKQWLNPSHPASRFTVGSLDTLRDREGASVRDQLIEFYEQRYSSNIMTLVILGKQPLGELEQLARRYFSAIPDKNLVPQKFTRPYMNPELAPARLNTVTEKQQNSVSFVFPIPSTLSQYRSKPLDYIANLLGHEGDGSLYSVLKDAGWVEDLSAGRGYMDQVQGQFEVHIGLTRQGLQRIDEIGERLFEAIALIRDTGIEQWRFEEEGKLSQIDFRFARERDPARVVQSLASRLQLYPPLDVLQGPYLFSSFDAQRIRRLLARLTPANVYVNVVSQTLETDRITEHYEVSYGIEQISDEWITRWNNALAGQADRLTSGDVGELGLPAANPFIPQRLDLIGFENPPPVPQQIPTGSGVRLWYRPDDQFATPRANLYFNIISPVANSSAKDSVLTELVVRLLVSQLDKTVYPALLAGMDYDLYRHGKGISVKLSGYEDRQSELLEMIVDAFLHSQFDEQLFEVVKAGLQRELHNVARKSPSDQSIHEIYRLLLLPYWTESERLQALAETTRQDVEKFVERFFEKVKVNALSHGDISVENSLARVAIINSLFDNSEFVEQDFAPKVRILDRSKRYLRTVATEHTDSALSWYYQGWRSTVDERAKAALLASLLESPFYTRLRTDNRTGYLVYSSTLNILEMPGLLFSVQSPSHSPGRIKALYDEFTRDFAGQLNEMTEAQFDAVKAGLLIEVRHKDRNLAERSARYWREIDRQEFGFDSRDQFDAALSALTLTGVQKYFNALIASVGGELAVQIAGSRDPSGEGLITGDIFEATGDATAFRLIDTGQTTTLTNEQD